MTKFTKYTCFVMVLLGSSYNSYAASFDCKKAATLVEQAICSNQKLSNLDQQLATMYKKALLFISLPFFLAACLSTGAGVVTNEEDAVHALTDALHHRKRRVVAAVQHRPGIEFFD